VVVPAGGVHVPVGAVCVAEVVGGVNVFPTGGVHVPVGAVCVVKATGGVWVAWLVDSVCVVEATGGVWVVAPVGIVFTLVVAILKSPRRLLRKIV